MGDAVDVCVALCAGDGERVEIDGVDVGAGWVEREGDGVAADAAEGVDDGGWGSGRGGEDFGGDVGGDFFRGDFEPGVVCEPDARVEEGEEVVALLPVPGEG